MEVIISIVGSLVAKAAEYTVDPTARQLSYLFKPNTKFLNLRTKVRDLEDARQRLQQSVDAANRNGEVIFDDVQRWLTEVNEKISEQAATQLQEDEEKAAKRCFAGLCPDFKSRYHLSKKADREANAIAQLLNQKDKFDRFSYLPALEAIEVIRPVKEYESFESRSGAFDGVMAALEDDAVSIIGVYGMGGVGKTTLVKEAAKQAKEKQLFDVVALVAVTQTQNMENIQCEIAEKIGLTIVEKSIDMRAARLRERLKREKKVLIILDDIWVTLDLEELGIPSGDEHKGCKILITSRRLDVLESMNWQPNISIETLKEDEAWDLFKNVAGHIAEISDLKSTAVEVAKRCAGLPIAIATVAKALKLKQNSYEWKDALEKLKPSKINFRGISGVVYSAIEMSYKYLETEELKFTFLLCSIMGHNAAIQDLVKHCRGLGLFHGLDTMEKVRNRVLTLVSKLKDSSLLLAGSTPERFDMHDVVCDVAISIASRDRRWLSLRKEDVFEEWSSEDTMKNSDLVSLKYAKVSELPDELECPNLTFFSMYGTAEVPDNFFKGMQRLKVLEFVKTKFISLPSSFPSLKTLCTLLLRNSDLKDVAILGELEHLEILDLRRSRRITVLPKEIGKLTRLKLLDLSDCYNLKVILPNVLSKLSRLEELYLYDSFERWEVDGIENSRSNASLVELQHLSCLSTLEVHIPQVKAIPKDNLFFEKMERYKISIGDEKWGFYFDKRMETSRMLKLKFNKSIHLVDGIYKLLSRKTDSLLLDRVEDVWGMLSDPNVESFGTLRFIKINNCNMLKNLFSFSIAKRFHKLEELEVSNCENVTELIVRKEEISENDIVKFSKLRILQLKNLNNFNGSWFLENIFQSATWLIDRKVSCPVLEELYLDSVGGIEKIWHIDDQLPLMSFGVQSLTSLTVKECHKLKYVFTSSMVKGFVHLKTLKVSRCNELEGVIEGTLAATEEERLSGSINVFPKLDSLELIWLPKLKRFCRGISPIEFPSLKRLQIGKCPNLNTFPFDNGRDRATVPHYLFNEMVILSVLEELEIVDMANLERLWPNQLAEHSFSKLSSIGLSFCHKLLNVFPLSMLTRLRRLEKLSIYDCRSVEEIIFGSRSQSREGSNRRAMPSLSPPFIFEFTQLTSLNLIRLPNLKSFHHNKMHVINWPSLKEMRVKYCHRVEILFASRETSSQQPLFWVNESSFPNLHQLTLGFGWNAGIKEIIWHCEEQQQQQQHLSRYFRNLKVVKLEQVTVLTSYLFQLLSLPNLQTLEISHSSFKEMIYQSEEGGEEKSAPLLLSQITELRLDHLTELMHLWKEKEGFQNLRIFHVKNCSRLKFNLVPSSISFRNLVTLKVERCDGIIKLITHSTAKSLVQLKEMSIESCQNIQEIIQSRADDDDDDDEIGFRQLNRLELGYLPKLESFCSSGNYTFTFPSLEILLVYDCPKMKMFSQGDSNTLMLRKVILQRWGYQEHWEGSPNTNIHQLFRQKCTVAEN